MASLKEMAIAAEYQQQASGSSSAFRQGLLFAIQQMAQIVQQRHSAGEPLPEEAFELYCEFTEWLFDLESYLETVDRN